MVDFRELVKAGVHFGHQRSRWCPKMARFIWGFKNDVHLIDVSKTANQLEKAAQFLESVAAENKSILWVGTKKAAQKIIKQAADKVKQPRVTHRWIGGTLTNKDQVRKSVTKLLHFEDVLKKSEQFPYTKKELNTIKKKLDRLEANVGGIRHLRWPIGAVVVVDVRKEQAAVREAANMGIPIVAMVDTNSDPTLIDYVIPSNDDAPRAIELVVSHLADAVERGQKAASEAAKAKKAASEKVEAKSKTSVPKKEFKKETKTKVEAKPAERKAAPKKVTENAPAKKVIKKDMDKK